MIRFLLTLFLFLVVVTNVNAEVSIQLLGEESQTKISSVYQRDGIFFLPLREILPPLHLSGVWDGAKRLYRIKATDGEILLAPGSRKLRYGKQALSLKAAPRFFNGELCVPEEVMIKHLPRLLGVQIDYVNQEGDAQQLNHFFAGIEGTEESLSIPLQQIIIDPGHGGDDPGAISPEGVKEKDLTLALALRLEKILKMDGMAPILLTRDGDYAVSLPKRSRDMLGDADANILISLHASSWRISETQGCTIYLLPPPDNAEEDISLLLAQSFGVALQGAGVVDCSIARAYLFPLSLTPFPAVLIELGYLTNPDDLSLLSSSNGQERIAQALSAGVKKYAENRPRRTIDVPVTQ